MISVLIVEDDSFISEDLAGQIQDAGYELCGQAYDKKEALEFLKTKNPDLVLLDINLNGENAGLEIAKEINAHYKIPFIYITSHSDPATLKKVNETKPHGYLLKPFDEKALIANIQLAVHKHKQEKREHLQEKIADSIFVKVKSALVKIEFDEILFAEAYDNYCYIKTASEKHLLSQTLKSVEEKLDGKGFLRVHRGFLINVSKIQSVTESNVFVDNTPIPIGRTFRDELLALLNTL
ncbi:MAG: response regulator [Crocinitomicaceae bacterium]|nr:response regulator [Crocinitomicaceae bacterium]